MLGNEFLLMILYMLILGFFFICTISAWSNIANLSKYLCLLVIIHTFMQSIINFYLAYLQSKKHSSLYAFTSVLYGVGSTLLGILRASQLDTNRYMGFVYSILICRTIYALYGTIDMWKDFNFTWNKEIKKEIYHFCLPLIPHMISSFLLNYVDRYMIDEIIGKSESGLYSFAYNFGLIVNIVVMAINQTYSPEFFELMNKKDYQGILRKITWYQKGLLSISTFVVVYAYEAIYIWANPKFHAGSQLVPMICYGYIIFHLYATISAYATYYKRNTYIACVSILASVINIILNYFFISRYGYQAAAYTTAVSYFIQYVICRIGNRHVLRCETHELNSSLYRLLGFILISYVGLYLIGIFHFHIVSGMLVKLVLVAIIFAFIWKEELYGKVKHS